MPPQRNVKKSSNKLINTKKKPRFVNITLTLLEIHFFSVPKWITSMAKVNNSAIWIIAYNIYFLDRCVYGFSVISINTIIERHFPIHDSTEFHHC